MTDVALGDLSHAPQQLDIQALKGGEGWALSPAEGAVGRHLPHADDAVAALAV